MAAYEKNELVNFFDNGLIAGLQLAVDAVDVSIASHNLTGIAESNFREFQRILQESIIEYSKDQNITPIIQETLQ